MKARCWLVVGAALLFARPGPAYSAQPAHLDAAALLRAAVDSDELDLAALVARIGDDAVLESLAEGKDSVIRFAAIRAAPYLLSQELALQPLAALAQGRDPDLAPAAARRVLVIAQALVLEDISARELSPDTFRAAELQLAALASSATAHRNVRLCAGQAAHLLKVIGSANGS
jgi:hypothetical protein